MSPWSNVLAVTKEGQGPAADCPHPMPTTPFTRTLFLIMYHRPKTHDLQTFEALLGNINDLKYEESAREAITSNECLIICLQNVTSCTLQSCAAHIVLYKSHVMWDLAVFYCVWHYGRCSLQE